MHRMNNLSLSTEKNAEESEKINEIRKNLVRIESVQNHRTAEFI